MYTICIIYHAHTQKKLLISLKKDIIIKEQHTTTLIIWQAIDSPTG